MLDGIGHRATRSTRAWCAASTTTSRTVFEWITDALGAQDAVCSGGRYDGLIAQLGGEATPAIGFAMGMERLVTLLVQRGQRAGSRPPGRLRGGERRRRRAPGPCSWSSGCASAAPQLRIELNLGGGNFKAQFRRADKSGARLALIVGEDELARGVVGSETFTRAGGSERVPDRGAGRGVDRRWRCCAAGRHARGMTLGRMRGRVLNEKRTMGMGQAVAARERPRRSWPAWPVLGSGSAAGAGGRHRQDAARLAAGSRLHADGRGLRARRPRPGDAACSGSWSATYAGPAYADQAQAACRARVRGGQRARQGGRPS